MPGRGAGSVLYCGSVLADYDFKQFYTVLGCKEFLGDFAKRYLRDLLDLTAEQGATLEIKPHFNEEDGWNACIRAHAPQARYRLHSHRQDLIELIRKADVVVTPESSVICEAIMLRKPVIVLNYGAQPLASAHYEGRGMVWHARNTEGLREGLQKCLRSADYLSGLKDARSRSFGFFAGAFDGEAGARVADTIQEAIA
jgi:glycosyltransferase involved in cell wall biosynthesis